MDKTERHHEAYEEVALDYRTLFMGCCSVIVLLSGSVYGLWSRGLDQAAEDTRATNIRQWERIAQLEARQIELAEQLKSAIKSGDDREARLRHLERLVTQREGK